MRAEGRNATVTCDGRTVAVARFAGAERFPVGELHGATVPAGRRFVLRSRAGEERTVEFRSRERFAFTLMARYVDAAIAQQPRGLDKVDHLRLLRASGLLAPPDWFAESLSQYCSIIAMHHRSVAEQTMSSLVISSVDRMGNKRVRDEVLRSKLLLHLEIQQAGSSHIIDVVAESVRQGVLTVSQATTVQSLGIVEVGRQAVEFMSDFDDLLCLFGARPRL